MFDQDIWFYYTFSSVIFRFSLMSAMYEKNYLFGLHGFFVFAKICVANIRFDFRNSHQRCSKKKAVFRLITIFTVIAIFNLLLNRRLVLAKTKFLLISILILKAIDFILKSKRFTSQSSLQAFKRYILDMTFFLCFFGHSWISLICLMNLSLPNLYLYIIRSITMFLKVLSKVNFRALTQT